jgi:hypothetical protein
VWAGWPQLGVMLSRAGPLRWQGWLEGPAWFATKFLLRFFETRTLAPFAVYCVAAGVIYFAAMLIIG